MLLDARNSTEVPDRISGNVVIVGAGTIGLFMAVNLAHAKIPVVLIEAGGPVTDVIQNYRTAESVGKPHSGATIGRAFGLGGTSVLWGGQLAEFERNDLIQENLSWPLSYVELQSCYDDVYQFLRMRKRLPDHVYRRKFGGEAKSHESIERFFTTWLNQPNFAIRFRKEIVSNPLIKVVLNAVVNDIAFSGSKAEELRASTPVGRSIRVSGDRFVFASGTIETSRFFLSTQRLSDVPWKRNQNVGSFFQDHLGGKIADVVIINEQRLRDFFENAICAGIKIQPKLRFAPSARRRPVNGVTGFFTFDSQIRDNVDNIKRLVRSVKSGTEYSRLATVPADVRALGWAFFPLVMRYVLDRRIRAFFDKTIEFHVQAEQLPIKNSRIKLLEGGQGNDGLFKAGIDWRVDGCEMTTISNFARQADAYLQQQGIARLRIDQTLLRGDPAFLSKLGDTYHQCGGMRMTESPGAGVVDSDCRIWDTTNVYVAGASVFPTSSHANCTLTALALAARLTKTIKHA